MKYIEVDLVNLADQDMNEELRSKNIIRKGKTSFTYLT
jgi:hypothetical protein